MPREGEQRESRPFAERATRMLNTFPRRNIVLKPNMVAQIALYPKKGTKHTFVRFSGKRTGDSKTFFKPSHAPKGVGEGESRQNSQIYQLVKKSQIEESSFRNFKDQIQSVNGIKLVFKKKLIIKGFTVYRIVVCCSELMGNPNTFYS
ncbi:hypothetical protein LguiA_016379 [Lonicera macranthoides]